MIRSWNFAGRVAFWVGWPALWFYLHNTQRTRVIIEYQGKIVVVKGWLGDGQWMLPGGGCHPNEKPAVAACRELREEAGLEIRPDDLQPLGSFSSRQHGFRYRYDLFVIHLSAEPTFATPSGEITHIELRTPTELQALSTHSDLSNALARWSG